jgi:hypothetical protein
MKSLVFFLAVALAFGACSTGMQLDQSLARQSNTYAVKGRQGWLLNQHLSIGPYQTGKVQRGWTRSYDIPFVVRFQGAKEKLNFTVTDQTDAALNAEVFALGKITAQDLVILNDLFEVPLKNHDVFTAAIYVPGSRAHWQLAVNDPNKRLLGDVASGVLEHEGQVIRVEEVRHTEKGHKNLGELVLGYNFVENGRVIAAVETLNNGRVVLQADLPAEKRLVLTSAAAALLLRSDIGQKIDQ